MIHRDRPSEMGHRRPTAAVIAAATVCTHLQGTLHSYAVTCGGSRPPADADVAQSTHVFRNHRRVRQMTLLLADCLRYCIDGTPRR